MFDVHSGVLPKKLLAAVRDDRPHTQISQQRTSLWRLLWHAVLTPLVILLVTLGPAS
jgi:hypothetical protein